MAGFATELLDGATLTVETALTPAMSVDLTPDDAPPGPLTQLLRPRYTLRRGNVVLLVHEPSGRLEEHRLVAFAIVLALVFVVMAFLD